MSALWTDAEVERLRRVQLAEINNDSGTRQELAKLHGRVWDTAELAKEFSVTGFMAPYVVVRRLSDGVVGSLEFQHRPRYYFNFQEDKK